MRKFRSDLVPKPRDMEFHWNEALGTQIPVDLEIGAGVGRHSIEYAASNPSRHIIAIERTREKFEKFQRRFDNHELNNLTIIHDDAIHWLNHYGRPELFSKVFILYPNPEPKNPNQRLGNMPFVGFLKDLMKENGTLEIRTNIPEYFEEAKESLVENWNFELHTEKILKSREQFTTHFEIKYLGRGEICKKGVFLKT